jgi:hypothetical protein
MRSVTSLGQSDDEDGEGADAEDGEGADAEDDEGADAERDVVGAERRRGRLVSRCGGRRGSRCGGRRGSRCGGRRRWKDAAARCEMRGRCSFAERKGTAQGRRLGQAPPVSIHGVQISCTPRVRTYPRRTARVYASNAGMWGRPLNRVRCPPVNTRGVQTTCTPRVCPRLRRTAILYATDGD